MHNMALNTDGQNAAHFARRLALRYPLNNKGKDNGKW